MKREELRRKIGEKKEELARMKNLNLNNFSNLMKLKKIMEEVYYLLDEFFEESAKLEKQQ